MADDITMLYVAMMQLHSASTPPEVLCALREIVINLIGSERFVVYATGPGSRLHVLTQEGLADAAERARRPNALLARTLSSGQASFAVDLPDEETDGALACAPLLLHGRVVGALIVYGLVAHKPELESIDQGLLDVIARQAAPALLCAQLLAGESSLEVLLPQIVAA